MALNLPLGRIPTRPLSYSKVALALNKELSVDWETGEIYLKLSDGSVVNANKRIEEKINDLGLEVVDGHLCAVYDDEET